MNRAERRKQLQELNRQERRRKRELTRKINVLEKRFGGAQYLSEDDAIKFLEELKLWKKE